MLKCNPEEDQPLQTKPSFRLGLGDEPSGPLDRVVPTLRWNFGSETCGLFDWVSLGWVGFRMVRLGVLERGKVEPGDWIPAE